MSRVCYPICQLLTSIQQHFLRCTGRLDEDEEEEEEDQKLKQEQEQVARTGWE